MNIVVLPYGQTRVICRPDTTWERENKDIFVPDDVIGFDYCPILFARVSKAGKSIGAKFADRYYDSLNYGVLLYPIFEESEESALAQASCMDHTSILPFPLYNKVTLDNGDNAFELFLGEKKIFSTTEGNCATLSELAVKASTHTSLRIGDLICIELDRPKPLPIKGFPSTGAESQTQENKQDTYIRATFCENEIFNLKIRF